MHFIDGNEINFPYLLLCGLRKMAFSVKMEYKYIDNAPCHHGLIKILIEAHLEAKGDNWKYFLVYNYFVETREEETSKRVKRSWCKSLLSPNPEEEIEK